MKSKFKVGHLLPIVLAKAMLIFLIYLLTHSFLTNPTPPNGVVSGLYIALLFLAFVLLREAKFKWNKIEMTNDSLFIKPFFGLWTKTIRLDQIDGFKRANEPSKTSLGDTLYVYVNGLREFEISDAYYRNYSELNMLFSTRTKKLGRENFNIFKNIKNAFGVPIRLTNDRKGSKRKL
jgi:hypothetical protein